MSGFDLDFGSTNADDDFFGNLERRSNLGQLFGIETNADDTLKYQPTKQPQSNRSTTTVTPQQQQWATVIAKIATVYRQGESMGKVGVALLKNSTNECKIILYKTKTNVLTTLTLQAETRSAAGQEQLHRQQRYLQFYDDNKIYWSLLFDSEADESAFIEQCAELNINMKEESASSDSTELKKETEETVEIIKELPARKHSVEETKNKNIHSKSSIISRMAKMGQQLPRFQETPQHSTEYSDSSDTELIDTNTAVISSKPAILPRSNKLQNKSQIVATSTSTLATFEPVSVINPIDTQYMQMLFTENRTQNIEVRMNINKLEGRIEKVLDKIELLNTGAHSKTNKEDEVLELEEKLLNLKKENRKLRQMLDNKKEHNDGEVLERVLKLHKEDIEELGVTVTRDLSKLIENFVNRLQNLDGDNKKLRDELSASKELYKSIEAKLSAAREAHTKELVQINDLEVMKNNLEMKLEAGEKEKMELEQKVIRLNESQKKEQDLNRTQTENTIKTIMNNLYGNLITKIENTNATHKEEILAVIGKTIKEESLKAMQQLKQ